MFFAAVRRQLHVMTLRRSEGGRLAVGMFPAKRRSGGDRTWQERRSTNRPRARCSVRVNFRSDARRDGSHVDRFESGWPRWPVALRRGLGGDIMSPDLDVRDNGRELTIECELPGVEEKDVAVTLTNGMLTIKGEKKTAREETKDNYYLSERTYGSFERACVLLDMYRREQSSRLSSPRACSRIEAEKRRL